MTTTLAVPVVTANMSIAVWQYGSSGVEFFSPDPFSNFVNAMSMLAFTTAAQADWAGSDRRGTGSWDTTLEQYVDSLWIVQSSKDNFIYPFLAALNGTSTSQNKTVAARGGVAFLARPTTVINYQPYPYQNARDGLKAVADAMIAQLTTTNVHTGTEVVGLAKVGNEFVVTDAASQQYTFDQIVLALPPYPAKALVNQLGAGGAAIKAPSCPPARWPKASPQHRPASPRSTPTSRPSGSRPRRGAARRAAPCPGTTASPQVEIDPTTGSGARVRRGAGSASHGRRRGASRRS